MTDFLNSLKTDLSDRRLLPFVGLVAFALVAAIAYVTLSGGSSSPTPTASTSTSPVTAVGANLAVSQTKTEDPTAETTEGTAAQHHGIARNPFAPLPSTSATTTTSTATTPAAAKGSTPTSSSGGSTPTSTTPTKTTPPKPTKSKTVYHVAALFGVAPAGSNPQTLVLTPYENLKLLTPLPSAEEPLVAFRGVTTAGHSATFTVVGEVILRGQANCLPSAEQCQAIDLAPGQSEQLEIQPPYGPAVVYELKIVSIAASKASTATAKSLLGSVSKAGRELLRKAGLLAIPDLHYSSQLGVLAFAGHPAFAARAHGARRSRASH